MQSTATYPTWTHTRMLAPPRSGAVAYFRALTMCAWLVSLLVRLWWISDWQAYEELQVSGVNFKQFYFYGFGLALAGHLTLGLFAWVTVPFVVNDCWSGRLFTLYCILMSLTAPLSATPYESIKYALATYGVFCLCTLFWQSNYFVLQRVLVLTGFIILGWIYLLMFKHGLTRGFGGHIGGINRNITGSASVGAMILCQLSPRKALRWTAIGLTLFLNAAVSSRGSLVAAGVFFVAYYVIHKGSFKAAVHGLIALAAAGLTLLVSSAVYDVLVNDVMKLHDSARGMGSGFTGRFEMWMQALEAFWRRPILGYGFRSTTMGAGSGVDWGSIHSGYLRIFLESGLIGGVIVLAVVVVELFRRFRLALRFRGLAAESSPGINLVESIRINSIACGTLAMTLALWVYEQHYINLGSVISLTMFLMITSPILITKEGDPLRK